MGARKEERGGVGAHEPGSPCAQSRAAADLYHPEEGKGRAGQGRDWGDLRGRLSCGHATSRTNHGTHPISCNSDGTHSPVLSAAGKRSSLHRALCLTKRAKRTRAAVTVAVVAPPVRCGWWHFYTTTRGPQLPFRSLSRGFGQPHAAPRNEGTEPESREQRSTAAAAAAAASSSLGC